MSNIALNPQTGELLVIDKSGQWVAPDIAENPQTRERLYRDPGSGSWNPFPVDPTGGRKTAESYSMAPTPSKSLMQGMTFGLADEVAAAGRSAGRWLKNATQGDTGVSPSQAYDQTLAAERQALAEERKEAPVMSAVKEVVGGFTSTMPRAVFSTMAPVSAELLRQPAPAILQRAPVAAATTGALTGFGSAEGGAENRLEGAAIGGTLGAAIATVAPYVGRALQWGWTRVGNATGLRNPQNAGMDQVLRAFERDGISLEDATDRLRTWQAQGAKPETLFDLGGENVRSLAQAAASVPGQAKQKAVETITARQQGQGARIASDIGDNLSSAKFYDSIDDLNRARMSAAKPLYDEAFAAGPVHSDRVAGFLADPTIQQGIKKNLATQRLEALAEGRPFNPTDYAVTGFNQAGDPVMGQVPNMRLLDAAKRGLDEIIDEARDAVTGKIKWTQHLRAVDKARQSLLSELDALNPKYAPARAAWSGPSQSMDALNMGRNALKVDEELTAKTIAELSPGDKEYFRAGLSRALIDMAKATKDGADKASRIFGSDLVRDRLRAAFDNDQAFNKFASLMQREIGMAKANNMVNPRVNSPTERIRQTVEDMQVDPATGFLGRMAEGMSQGQGVVASTLGAARNSPMYRRMQGIAPNTADALSGMLYNTDPAANAQVLNRLSLRHMENTANQEYIRALTRALMADTGAGLSALAN